MKLFILLIITFIVLLILFVIWGLTALVVIKVNTRQQQYELMWGRLVKGTLSFQDEYLLINIHLFFLRKMFKINWIKLFVESKSSSPSKDENLKKNHRDEKPQFIRVWRVIKSFSADKIHLDLDTDNYCTNAYLFPLCYFATKYLGWLNRSKVNDVKLNINFIGENEIDLAISNRFIRILIAYYFK